MREIKTIIAVATLCCIVFYISACSPDTKDNPIQVRILVSLENDYSKREAVQSYLNNFMNKYPSYKLLPTYVSSDVEGMLKIINAKNSGIKYDIAFLGSDNLFSLLEMNEILPLENYVMKSEGIRYIENFEPYAMGNAVYNDHLWSIPVYRKSVILYYRKDDPRLKISNNKATLEQVFNISKQYASKYSKTALTLPVQDILTEYTAYTSKSGLRDKKKIEGTYLSVDSIKNQDILFMMQSLASLKAVRDYGDDFAGGIQNFINGSVPMLICSSDKYSSINGLLPSEKFGIKVLYLDEMTTFPTSGMNMYMLKSWDGKDYSDIWKVAEWFSDDNTISTFAVKANGLPLKKLYCKFLETNYYINKNIDFLNLSTAEYNSYSSLAVYQNSKIVRQLEISLSDIIRPGSDIKAMLKELQNKIDSILEPYNSSLSVG